jgi:protein gp37
VIADQQSKIATVFQVSMRDDFIKKKVEALLFIKKIINFINNETEHVKHVLFHRSEKVKSCKFFWLLLFYTGSFIISSIMSCWLEWA